MADAIQLLDHDDAVERYAWFAPRTAGDWLGPSASLLQADRPELTDLGKLYTAEQIQPTTVDTASGTQSWTSMCSPCFVLNQVFDDVQTEQLCNACGFRSS